jgi:hypothetical protein
LDLGSRSRQWLAPAAVALLILIGCVRVASTWKVFAHTSDEIAHIACGLEWWTAGSYGSEVQHPPLARIMAGLGPYMLGQRWSGSWEMWTEGQRILENGDYVRNLAAARAGILVFFVLASVCTWLWMLELAGPWPAVCAVFLLTNAPPVLAHAGLATTDMAATAGFIAAAYTIDRWLIRPTIARSILAGLGIAAAVFSKFSVVLFLALALIPLLLIRRRTLSLRHLSTFAVVTAGFVFCMMAVYHFSFQPVQPHPHPAVGAVLGTFSTNEPVKALVRWLADAPAVIAGPALGLLEVASHGKRGHGAYLMGEIRSHGWWYFFPVAVMVKTQKTLLALLFVGMLVLVFQKKLLTPMGLPLWAGIAVMAVCINSPINLGVRHALPVYPLLCMIAAAGVMALWQIREKALRVMVIAALGYIGAQSAMAHPDYLAYFNLDEKEKPENVLVDSDLDWGQDVLRLCRWAQDHNVDEMSIAVFTNANLDKLGLKKVHVLRPYEHATGWVARSVTMEKLRTVEWAQPGHPDGAFDWLKAYTPVTRVGKSIDVFYIK